METLTEDQNRELLKMVDARLNAEAQAEAGKKDVSILHDGTAITLPADPTKMDIPTAVDVLKRRYKEDKQTVEVHEMVEAFPFDGAYAFMRALKTIFGWVGNKATPSMFGPQPPAFISLEVGYRQYAQVAWGRFSVPGIEGYLETGAWSTEGRWIFKIGGEVERRHLPEVKRIAEMTREIVRESSVYRGQAIRLVTDDDGALDMNEQPKFLNIKNVKPEELIFSDLVQEQVNTNLFTPITKTEECRKFGVPLKRGVLLAGPYGCGKTLTAYVTAKMCAANGWTFIMLDKVASLAQTLKFARMYAPAVVFSEDIDRVLEGERDSSMDEVLNTVDGLDSKDSEILVVLTTNHVEKIHPAMLRPGRLDSVISILPPDAKAVEKLTRCYARDTLAKTEKLTAAGKALNGEIPAIIREVVERSKLYSISRGGDMNLKGADIVAAAEGMREHLKLLKPQTDDKSDGDKLAEALVAVTGQKANGEAKEFKDMAARVKSIYHATC